MNQAINNDSRHGVHRGERLGMMHDEEVVSLAKSGHTAAAECLLSRYRPLVETKAKAYFVAGADHDDVIQEGLIGLYKAIRDFRVDKFNKFRPFAELCVTRQIITAVKTATRQKHLPLNRYVSLDAAANEAGEAQKSEPSQDARVSYISGRAYGEPVFPPNFQESVQHILSDLECGVLRCYLDGMTYQEMSAALACHTKSIDNALQRVKRKIGSLLRD